MHVPSLNFDLGEDIDLLRQSVAHFAAAEIAPLAAETDATTSSRWHYGPSWASRACWA